MSKATATPRSTQRVLDFVNRIRVATGKKPLKNIKKGVRNRVSLCPIANSIGIPGVDVLGSCLEIEKVNEKKLKDICLAVGLSASDTAYALEAYYQRGIASVRVPEYVERFVDRFDAGLLPEYVA